MPSAWRETQLHPPGAFYRCARMSACHRSCAQRKHTRSAPPWLPPISYRCYHGAADACMAQWAHGTSSSKTPSKMDKFDYKPIQRTGPFIYPQVIQRTEKLPHHVPDLRVHTRTHLLLRVVQSLLVTKDKQSIMKTGSQWRTLNLPYKYAPAQWCDGQHDKSACPLWPPAENRTQWKTHKTSLGLCSLGCEFEAECKRLDQGRGAGSTYGACISEHGCYEGLHSLLASLAVGEQVLKGSHSSIKGEGRIVNE